MIYIAICDSNEGDLLHLKELILEILGSYYIQCNIYEFDSGEKLLESPLIFQLVFLDIALNGKDGIETGNIIYKKNHAIKIIFQTNFNQYCKEAINRTHAFAFLEKPLQKEILEEQLNEYIDNNENTSDIQITFNNVKYIVKEKEVEDYFVSLSVKNIIYFECIKLKKEIKIVTEQGNYIFTDTMSAIEEKMAPFGFETCCRGILVNIKKIRKIKGYTVFLNNGDSKPLSQRRVSEFKERVNQYVLQAKKLDIRKNACTKPYV